MACIATDPALSAKVNRAQHGKLLRRDVHQAAVAVGVDRTREISLTAATAAYAGKAVERQSLQPAGITLWSAR